MRLFNVFGPGQDPLSQYAAVVPRFIKALLEGEAPIIYGDGSQTRDFTYVDDVVDAFVLAAEAEGVGGELFNVAAGAETSILDLIATLHELLGSSVEPQFEPPRSAEVLRSRGDRSKAEGALGWSPKWPLKGALRLCIAAASSDAPLVPDADVPRMA